jgi:protein TonB
MPKDEPALDRTLLVGILLALAFNAALATWIFSVRERAQDAEDRVEFALVEPPPPPPPEPEPPTPEKPKVVDFQAPPPPTDVAADDEPPPEEPPKPIFGLSMSSTVDAGSGDFKVRVGNTLMKEPEKEPVSPGDVKPLRQVSFTKLDEAPDLIRDFRAEYPAGPKAEGIEGTVLLKLTIDDKGNVTEANVVRGIHPELDSAARAACFRFRWKPGRSGGEPVITTNYLYKYTWLIEG